MLLILEEQKLTAKKQSFHDADYNDVSDSNYGAVNKNCQNVHT